MMSTLYKRRRLGISHIGLCVAESVPLFRNVTLYGCSKCLSLFITVTLQTEIGRHGLSGLCVAEHVTMV